LLTTKKSKNNRKNLELQERAGGPNKGELGTSSTKSSNGENTTQEPQIRKISI
jgi:hypothetical protein